MVVKFAVLAVLIVAVSGTDYTKFSYDVMDPKTGDIKGQKEERIDDSVVGAYSLIEPDGTKRIVEYTADDLHGFNAVVKKEPAPAIPIIKQVATPISIAPAPISSLYYPYLLPSSSASISRARMGLPTYPSQLLSSYYGSYFPRLGGYRTYFPYYKK